MPRELLFKIPRKDFRMDVFRSGGHGGQNQNKVSSGVRITHLPSGAVGESREERDQIQNRRNAFRRLSESPTFRAWLNRAVYEHEQQRTIEQEVDDLLAPEHVTVETHDGERWVPWSEPSES